MPKSTHRKYSRVDQKAVRSYSVSTTSFEWLFIYVTFPLLIIGVGYLAWVFINEGSVFEAAVNGLLFILLVLLLGPILKVRATKIIIRSDGIEKIEWKNKHIFIKWKDIFAPEDGWHYSNMYQGLSIFNSSGKLIMVVPFVMTDYDEIRERIVFEWSKLVPPKRLPTYFGRFPIFKLSLDSKGICFKQLHKTTFIAWNKVTFIQWGFYYLGRSAARMGRFIEVTGDNGRMIRIPGVLFPLTKIYVLLKRNSPKAKGYSIKDTLVVQSNKLSKNFWKSCAAGILWSILPGLYIGKVMFRGNGVSGILGFVLLILFIFGFTFSALKRKGLVVTSDTSQKPNDFASSILTMLVLVLSFYVTGTIVSYSGKRALENVKSKALSNGYSFAPPINAPHLGDNENAVYFMKKAVDAKSADSLLKADKNDKTFKPFYNNKSERDFLMDFHLHMLNGALSNEEIRYGKKLIAIHNESLNYLDEAYQKKRVDWGLDFNQSMYEMKYPLIGPHLTFTRLLICRAYLQARENRGIDAIQSLKTALFLGDSIRQTRSLMDVMVAAGIYKMVAQRIQIVLKGVDSSLIGRELLPLLNPQELINGLREAQQYEHFGGLQRRERNKWNGNFYGSFYNYDLTSDYEAQIKKMDVLKLPFSERTKAWNNALNEIEGNRWWLGSLMDSLDNDMFNKVLETASYCRMAQASVEAKIFKNKHNRWPDSVLDLKTGISEDFRDPFTDHDNLHFIPKGKNLLIYSFGPDGTDDHGTIKSSDKGKHYDLVLIVSE